MRGVIVLAVVAGLSAQVAEAQVKKSAVSEKRVSQVKRQNFNLIAQNTTTQEAAVDGSVSVPVEEVSQDASPSRFGLLIDIWNENNMGEVNRLNNEGAESDASVDTTVRPSYKLTDTTSIALALAANHTWGTTDGNDSSFSMYDPYLMLASSDLGSAGLLTTKGYVRLYLPISQDSRDAGQIAMVRLNGQASLPVGPLKITGTLEPRFYAQSDDSYKTAERGASRDDGTVTNNQYGRLLYSLKLSGPIVGPLSFYSEHGIRNDWFYRNDDAIANTEDRARYYNETMVSVAVGDNLEFAGGLFTKRN